MLNFVMIFECYTSKIHAKMINLSFNSYPNYNPTAFVATYVINSLKKLDAVRVGKI